MISIKPLPYSIIFQLTMKLITYAVLLIACHLTTAKQFDECEFAIELYSKHKVPREDIYKHFCIADTLHTTKDKEDRYKGIYEISSQWWCGLYSPDGSCNVKCSDLLDDDIADDVACANLILSQQGVGGWGKKEETCKQEFEQKTDDCLATIPLTTTEELIVPTTRPTLKTTTTSTQQSENSAFIGCSCVTINILLLIVDIILLGASIVILFKYRDLKRFVSSARNKEFEEHSFQ